MHCTDLMIYNFLTNIVTDFQSMSPRILSCTEVRSSCCRISCDCKHTLIINASRVTYSSHLYSDSVLLESGHIGDLPHRSEESAHGALESSVYVSTDEGAINQSPHAAQTITVTTHQHTPLGKKKYALNQTTWIYNPTRITRIQ